MAPKLQVAILLDSLLISGVITQAQYEISKDYIYSIPGSLRATIEDYEKWKMDQHEKV